MKRIITLHLIAFLAIFTAIGCKQSITGADRDAVLGYAEPITNSILTGYNNGSYAVYSKDFDEQMKNALPEKVFNQTRVLILEKIGKYASRNVSEVYKKNQFIVVLYSGKFEKEDNVEIKVVIQKIGDKNLVSGLWFNSPKLRK